MPFCISLLCCSLLLDNPCIQRKWLLKTLFCQSRSQRHSGLNDAITQHQRHLVSASRKAEKANCVSLVHSGSFSIRPKATETIATVNTMHCYPHFECHLQTIITLPLTVPTHLPYSPVLMLWHSSISSLTLIFAPVLWDALNHYHHHCPHFCLH